MLNNFVLPKNSGTHNCAIFLLVPKYSPNLTIMKKYNK